MMLERRDLDFPARSGSSLMAKMPAIGAGEAGRMNGQFVGKIATTASGANGSTSPMMSAMVTSEWLAFRQNAGRGGIQAMAAIIALVGYLFSRRRGRLTGEDRH